MLCRRLHFFPVAMALYLPVAFIITYAIAVGNGHVEPVFPYISDTGTVPPESCVFGQLLNIYAVLTFWCMYLRYKQVRLYYRSVESQGLDPTSTRGRSVRRKQIANRVCLGVGFFTAFGISVVANFQEDHVMSVHLMGAVLAFGGAGVYCWIQAILSYKMANLPKSLAWCRHTRVVLSILHAICFFIMLIATKVSLDKFPYSLKHIKKWKSSDPGYTEHLCATFSEWLMAFVSSTYFLTFMCELRVVRTKVQILQISVPSSDASVMPRGSPTPSSTNNNAQSSITHSEDILFSQENKNNGSADNTPVP